MRTRRVWWAVGSGAAGLLALSGGLWLRQAASSTQAAAQGVYTARGFGGALPVAERAPAVPQTEAEAALYRLTQAYQAGRYAEVEAQALPFVEQARTASDRTRRKQGLQAQLLSAYSAARRKDFSLAKERFAELREDAAALPDRGARPQPLGEVVPTFEEEAAFQQAVCTGALQGQEAAEAGYRRFVCNYPQSVLIHAAVKRIARYHGGDVPKEAETLWQQAMRLQKQQQETEAREGALCGPECLAELLRRQGKKAEVAGLAEAMGTSREGTTLAAMAEVARKQGFAAQGLELTQAGLAQQKLPVIALLSAGHYVLVEQVGPEQVTVWDPDAKGVGKAGRRAYGLAEWERAWRGIALTVE